MVLTQVNIDDSVWADLRIYCIKQNLSVNRGLEKFLKENLKKH